MQRSQQPLSQGGILVVFAVLANAIVLEMGLVSNVKWYGLLALTLPLFLFSVFVSKR